MDKAAFGARVRGARRRAGLTSEQVAELCECSPVSIRQIEGGARLPSLPKLVNLCNVLQVTPDELLRPELSMGAHCFGEPQKDVLELLVHWERLPPERAQIILKALEAMIPLLEQMD